jgi:hypothetical protein
LESYAKRPQGDDGVNEIPENSCTVSAPFRHRFSHLYLESYPKRAAGDEQSSRIPGITYAAGDGQCAKLPDFHNCHTICGIATRFVALSGKARADLPGCVCG